MQVLTKTRRRAVSEPKESVSTAVDPGRALRQPAHAGREVTKLLRFHNDPRPPGGGGCDLRRAGP